MLIYLEFGVSACGEKEGVKYITIYNVKVTISFLFIIFIIFKVFVTYN